MVASLTRSCNQHQDWWTDFMPVTMPGTAAEYRSYNADTLAEVHGQTRRHEKLLAGAWLICGLDDLAFHGQSSSQI